MICGKCNNSVPDNFAFCPYCGQKIEPPAPAPTELPVIARSAMPREEEYSGRYETGDMPAPAIRFSKNLAPAQQPAEPVKAEEPVAPVLPPVEEKPAEPVKVEEPAGPKCAACGAPLREGAKFCNICGQAVAQAEPVKEEEPVAPVLPPVEEKPAEPVKVEEPAGPKCAACGAPLREGAKFCNICGQAVAQAEPVKEEEPVAPVLPPVEEKPAEPVKEEEPAQPVCAACGALLKEGAKFCNICGQAVAQAEPVKEEEPVAPVLPPVEEKPAEPVKVEEPAGPKCAACGAPLREGAKFCNICGQAVAQAEPVKEEEPAAPVLPPVEEKPAEPVKVEEPAGPKCAACGAPLREGAKFCNICGQAVAQAEPVKEEEPVAPVLPPVEEKPAEPVKEEEPAQPVCAACGALLKEGAKFCNICGQAVAQAEPVKEEEPVAPVLPPVEEKPAEPVKEEEPAQPVCAACGALLKEGAKFCNICGQAVVKIEPFKTEESPVPEVPLTQQKPAAPVIPPMQQKPAAPVIPPMQQKPAAPVEQKPLAQQPVVEQKPLTQQPAAPAQWPALKKCPLCGTVVDADARLCTGCGVAFRVQGAAQQQPVTPAHQPAAPVKQKKAKPAGKKSKAPLAIALVALIVVGALIAGFLTNWFGLAGGPLDTVYNATDKTLRSGGFHVDFHVSVNAAVDVDGSADCIIDIEEKELTALVELKAMGQTARIGVMDGVAVMQNPNGDIQTMEIGYILDEVFESLEEEQSLDEALEMGVEMALEMSGLDDMVDADKAVKCVDKSLNSASWLKKNAGYSTESKDGAKVHVFAPKLGDLVIAAVEALEPAFEDADELEEGLEYLEEGKSELNRMADIEVALGVKGGKLVSISGEVSASGQDITAEVTFEDIGSAKVDVDEIEDMLDMAGNSDVAAAVEG